MAYWLLDVLPCLTHCDSANRRSRNAKAPADGALTNLARRPKFANLANLLIRQLRVAVGLAVNVHSGLKLSGRSLSALDSLSVNPGWASVAHGTSAAFEHFPIVVSGGSEMQMIQPNARRIIASVKHEQPLGNGADFQLPSGTMGRMMEELTVTCPVLAASPDMAGSQVRLMRGNRTLGIYQGVKQVEVGGRILMGHRTSPIQMWGATPGVLVTRSGFSLPNYTIQAIGKASTQ